MSKEYLAGTSAFEEALVHPLDWYADKDVDLRLSTRAVAVDAAAHEVELEDGSRMPYGKLVLATGSVPRHLDVPGADAEGVLYLRDKEDTEAIRDTFGPERRLVIIGGGWIGLEVASAARGAGTSVTVVEAAELPLVRVLGPEIAQVFADLHREHGVDLRLGSGVEEILVEDGRAAGVRLTGGEVVEADAVVVGVGVLPAVDLATSAGLELGDTGGVLVDASLRTSDPDIYAVGDIAEEEHPLLGRRIRLEHWFTALRQPRVAATALLGGEAAYDLLPYFYTDQFDLGMEYLGSVPRGTETSVVLRGDKEGRTFVAFWLDEGNRILAAMNVNVWDVQDQIKPLITEGRVVDPARLADPDVPYAEL